MRWGVKTKGKSSILCTKITDLALCCSFLKVSTHSRPTYEPQKERKRKKWLEQQSRKGTPVKWPSFLCTPTRSSLISGLPATNVSWKRSIGGSHRIGGRPEPWRHLSSVDRQPVSRSASTTTDGGWLWQWWWSNTGLETHICTGYTHAECYKHVLMVSVCAEERVGPIIGGWWWSF